MEPSLEEFMILLLRDFVDIDKEELLLLVRVVKWYLSRTEDLCSYCRNFLIATGRVMKVRRDTVPFWIRAIVIYTCKTPFEENWRAVKVKGHKVCSISLSILSKNYAGSQVMWAGT